VAGELQQARMKPNDVADALEDDRFQIVVEQHARGATKRLECGDMAAQKTLECLIEDEARVDRA